MKENPQIKLNIVETTDPADFNVGLFAHSKIGKNVDPKSKNDDFASLIRKGIGDKADIVFFKYCFIDFQPASNVRKVFSDYKSSISRLKNEYPKTRFTHVTVPLTIKQEGIKAWIKGIIGKPIGGYKDNIKRNQFNKLLQSEYEGKDQVFDLAKAESTFPDGTRLTFEEDGVTYYSMVWDYTDDGAHLNAKGSKRVAEQLLVFLTNLLK